MVDDLSRIPEVGPVRPAPIQNLSTSRAALTLCLLYCSDTVLQYLFRHWTTSFQKFLSLTGCHSWRICQNIFEPLVPACKFCSRLRADAQVITWNNQIFRALLAPSHTGGVNLSTYIPDAVLAWEHWGPRGWDLKCH